MTSAYIAYLASWSLASLAGLALLVKKRRELELFQRRYWAMLLTPWKVAVFVVATVGMTAMAPYAGDPTWDYVDAPLMALLSVATAPWSVAILWRALRGRRDPARLYLAGCLWMFSASWCYDLYILLRDGEYPLTWLPNSVASSLLYLLAGLLWSLEWRAGRGATLAFLESDWPTGRPTLSQGRMLLYALPLIALVVALMIPFLTA